jgi:hypothetical protein
MSDDIGDLVLFIAIYLIISMYGCSKPLILIDGMTCRDTAAGRECERREVIR